MNRRETSAEIDAAAAEWTIRIDDAPLSAESQQELQAWLADDPRRLGAYARARAMFAFAQRAKALAPGFDPEHFSVPSDRLAETPLLQDERQSVSRRGFLKWGSTAAAATSALGLLGYNLQAAAQTYSTGRGEIRLIALADGSSMTLNTETLARVQYDKHRRHIELQVGEALFDVVDDPLRPFDVAVSGMSVRARGTIFAVRRLADAPVEIVVRQGSVEVTRPALPADPPRLVGVNMLAIITPSAPFVTKHLANDEVQRVLAWRDGMLAFEDMPLRDAVQEFARYSDMRIRFADPQIGKETVTGLFAASNPGGFAQAASQALDLRVETTADGLLLTR
jgi:transmembrane sensor